MVLSTCCEPIILFNAFLEAISLLDVNQLYEVHIDLVEFYSCIYGVHEKSSHILPAEVLKRNGNLHALALLSKFPDF